MISLSFTVDKIYLLQHILKTQCTSKDFQLIKHALWRRNENLCYLLAQNIEPSICRGNFVSAIKDSLSNMRRDLSHIYNSPPFKRVLRQTNRYAFFVENQWKKNYAASLKIITDITRLDFSTIELHLKVFISHPELSRGRSYPDQKSIGWGHSEDWKNYSTVYLWHEIMHHLTYKSRANQTLMHALIELTCDNELRIRLNKRGHYFTEGAFSIGHRNLRELEKSVETRWRKYLPTPRLNLFGLEKKLRNEFPKKFPYQSPLERWADWH